MSLKSIPIAVLLTATTLSTSSYAGNFVDAQNTKFKVVKAQLAIKSPNVNVCPTPAKMAGWIFTNKPGKFQYLIARKGGTISGPYTIEAKKGANGIHMASFSKSFDVHFKTDTQYRILIGDKYGTTLSNWAPLKASCKIKLGG